MHSIPTGLDLFDDDPRALNAVADGSEAHQLWTLLTNQSGIGWVTAGELLAAKRPRRIPILDSEVSSLLDHPKGQFWVSMRETLRANPEVLDLLQEADVPDMITPLRRLDVALWMAAQAR